MELVVARVNSMVVTGNILCLSHCNLIRRVVLAALTVVGGAKAPTGPAEAKMHQSGKLIIIHYN